MSPVSQQTTNTQANGSSSPATASAPFVHVDSPHGRYTGVVLGVLVSATEFHDFFAFRLPIFVALFVIWTLYRLLRATAVFSTSTATYVPALTRFQQPTPQDVDKGIDLSIGAVVFRPQSFESTIGSSHTDKLWVSVTAANRIIPSGPGWVIFALPERLRTCNITVHTYCQNEGSELNVQRALLRFLSDQQRGENQRKPGRDWTVGNLDVRRLCGDGYTFKLVVMLRRVLQDTSTDFLHKRTRKRKLFADYAAMIYLHVGGHPG
ncbi:hypothetical protein BJ742DRAFT_775153 [Cladochytrium replicatum]|nr:hypothetical protein BJ742DRAFT_775153 [Cladochytrium replicatum]